MSHTLVALKCNSNLFFDSTKFGNDVLVKRMSEGHSRNKLAQMMNYSHLSGYLIERIEQGAKDPRVGLIVNLCAWMGKNINEYFKSKP